MTVMSELAYDAQGRPIRLPPTAARFLVREHRPKSAPKVLYRNGQRVTLPVAASLRDFRYAVNDVPARYRLLVLDEHDEPIDVPEAYVEIEPEPEAEPPPPFAAPSPDPLVASRTALAASSPTELLLLETVRANTELARATIDRLPEIMRSSAYLIHAADGAGMVRRPPPWWLEDEDDEDDDEDDEAEDAEESPLLALCKTALSGGNLGGFLKLLAPGDTGATAAPPADPLPPQQLTPPPIPEPRNAARPPDPQAHLLAILAPLSTDERAYAQRVFDQLSPAAVQQWRELLLSMSVDDAVAMIRAKAKGEET
jgi:hypothetical protein